MDGQIILLIVSVAFIAMALSGKVKIHVAAMLIPIALEVTGVLTFQEAWAGATNSSVVMMFAMFIVAAGFNKTDFIAKASRVFIKPGDSEFKLLLGIAVPTILLGSVVNGTATAALMLPIITQICAEHKRPLSKFIFPFMLISSSWVGLIPTGGNSGNFLAFNSIIAELGGVGEFTYFTNMIVKLPASLIISVFYLFVSNKLCPDVGNVPVLGTGAQAAAAGNAGRRAQKELSATQQMLAKLIFLFTVLGVVYSAVAGISVWYVPCIGALAMVLTGVLDDREAIRSGASPIIFLFIGTLPLATALTKTGADVTISNAFNAFTAGMSPFLVMMMMYLLCMILTQFLQNSTVSNVFRTLAAAIAVQNGFNPTAMFLAAVMGTANSYLLPTANAISNMLYETGGYNLKQWIRMGLLPSLIQFAVFMLWVPFLFPLV